MGAKGHARSVSNKHITEEISERHMCKGDKGTRKGMPLPYTDEGMLSVVWEGHPLAGALL